MGRPLRVQTENSIYFVSNRCFQRRFFFLPEKQVRQIILNCLAYAAHVHEVEIFFFVFMSNHFHMGVRAPKLNLHDFMELFQSTVATQLNRYWNRSSDFFDERYRASRILDDVSLREKLCYTVCNPCESNLVRHPDRWPGLSSWEIHGHQRTLVGRWEDRTEYWRLRRKYPDMTSEEASELATTEYELELAKLPEWEDLDDEEYRQKVCDCVETYAEDLATARRRPCLGARKVLDQSFDDRPREEDETSNQPLCHAECHDDRTQFVEQFRNVTDSYRKAMKRWRRGEEDVRFPPGTIPPGHRKCVPTGQSSSDPSDAQSDG